MEGSFIAKVRVLGKVSKYVVIPSDTAQALQLEPDKAYLFTIKEILG